MKILLYTYTFFPNLGGVEDIAHALATGWVENGEKVTVVTPTESNMERKTNYTVVRNPNFFQLMNLVRSHDIVHANGSTVQLFPFAVLLGKPFTWAHHGYQVLCIDGAGWAEGAPAPMDPWGSFLCHLKIFGLGKALIGGTKLAGRRLIAHLVTANVATSKHVAIRQPLPRQEIILNPIDQSFFSISNQDEAEKNLAKSLYTFTYVGRLISEKGVGDLLKALHYVREMEEKNFGKKSSNLRIMGKGPDKALLMDLAKTLNLEDCISWEVYPSHEVHAQLIEAGICVMPSIWEEPGAVTALELLALGKPLIVSQRGWLSECAGDAGLTFPNGDWQSLGQVMLQLAHDPQLQNTLIRNALARRSQFDSGASIKHYIALFKKCL